MNNCNISYDDYLRIRHNDFSSHTIVRSIFICLYGFILFSGLSGNLCVLTTILRLKQLKTIRNYFIVSLAISDIVVCLTSLPITAYTAMYKRWIFGSHLCYVIPQIQGIGIFISALTLAFIALDRFILIVLPHRTPIQKAQAVAIIACTWIIAVLISTPVTLHMSLTPAKQLIRDRDFKLCGEICHEQWLSPLEKKLGKFPVQRCVYGVCVLLLQYILPLALIAYCYLRIISKLGRRLSVTQLKAQRRSIGARLSDQGERTLFRQRKTNKILILLVLLFASVWFPQIVWNLLSDFQLLSSFGQSYFVAMIVHCISMTSTIWNPLVYSAVNDAFRQECSNFFECFFSRLKRQKRDFDHSTQCSYGPEHLRVPHEDRSNLAQNGATELLISVPNAIEPNSSLATTETAFSTQQIQRDPLSHV